MDLTGQARIQQRMGALSLKWTLDKYFQHYPIIK